MWNASSEIWWVHFTPSSKIGGKFSPNQWIPRCHQLLLFYQMPSFNVRVNIYLGPYGIPVTDIYDPLEFYNSNVIPYEGIVHSIPCFLHYVSKGTVYNAIAFGVTGLSGLTCTSIYRYRDTFVNKYICFSEYFWI